MRREELTEAFRSFEACEPVETWRWRDFAAWPVLRGHLAMALHGEAAEPRRSRAAEGAARLRRHLRCLRAERRQPLGPGQRTDWVLLSSADRLQRFGNGLVNSVVGPWAEAARRSGTRAALWELGEPRRPQGERVSVQHRLDRARWRDATPLAGPPAWFAALQDFALSKLGAALSWRGIERVLRGVAAHADCVGPWLERAGARALLLDCWYLPERMGASLAAHRLGLERIDLQHGVQGRAHPLYSGWLRRPAQGYEVLPDRYWVWGDWDAEALQRDNPGVIGPEQVRVVGHRWLDLWRRDADAPVREACREADALVGGRRAVLVTLQKGVPFRESLAPLVRRAPREWLWLVRLHRGMALDPARLEAELRAACGPVVEVQEASRLPLPALLRASAWHLTAFSTCALEALAFGVPSLLTDRSGAHAFSEFVAAGVMCAAASVDEQLACLRQDPSALAERCRSAAARLFAEPSQELPCTSC